MSLSQPGILETETLLARFLTFSISSSQDLLVAMESLANDVNIDNTVIGLGQSLVRATGKQITGLTSFPVLTSSAIDIPSTPAALWCWLRGKDRGEIYHRSRDIEEMLSPCFVLDDVVDSFQYDNNRDLTGYEDGTENPQGDEAIQTAIVRDKGAGMDGSSFVAVQQWKHDFDVFADMSTEERDNTIGRRISDNEEFDEAPESAHVKRVAQESFDPEAFILRRSIPWAKDMDGGLVFIAFGKSFDPFEAILNRMVGNDDGIVDALFHITRPMTGAYFWCPPIKDDKLDLSALGL